MFNFLIYLVLIAQSPCSVKQGFYNTIFVFQGMVAVKIQIFISVGWFSVDAKFEKSIQFFM